MAKPGLWFDIVDIVLFALLAIGAIIRVVWKVWSEQSTSYYRRSSRLSIWVLIIIGVYGLLRAVWLSLGAAGVYTMDGTLKTHLFAFIPAMFLLILQSLFLAKWESHVSELTLALRHDRWGSSAILVWSSVVVTVMCALVTIFAALDHFALHWTHASAHDWNVIITLVCGVVMIFNGLALGYLGIRLIRIWNPIASDKEAARRVHIVSLLFAFLCLGRGLCLCLFSLESNVHVHNVVHSDWGAQLVLLFEWIIVTISLGLLVLSSAGSQGNKNAIVLPYAYHYSQLAAYRQSQKKPTIGELAALMSNNSGETTTTFVSYSDGQHTGDLLKATPSRSNLSNTPQVQPLQHLR